MITIYQAEWCPYCKNVREWISENLHGVPIVYVAQPHDRNKRTETIKVSGQAFIPTMKDDETDTVIADDDEKIIEYLKDKFLPLSSNSA